MLTVRKDAIVVPLAAIQRGTQGTYVYTVKDGSATMQPVKLDMTQGNISLIASGLAAGDQVVVDGQDRLQSGSKVEAHGVSAGGPVVGGGTGGGDGAANHGKGGGHHGAGGDAAPAGNPAPGGAGDAPGSGKHHKDGGTQN